MNNNGNETVRETLERVMREKGYLRPENQITIKTPLGDFNYQSSLPQTAEQKPSDNADKEEFFIRDDKNYAWDIPKQYDYRGNWDSVINNFKIINQEHPIEAPKITGSSLGDIALKMLLVNKLSPLSQMKTFFDLGYLGAGYYDNFRRAYDESHRYDSKLNFGSNLNK